MALCGAIFLDFGKLEKRIKKCKNERKQYICQIFSSIFKETWKTVVALCGAMWRYFFGFWKTRKTDEKKCKNERKQYICHIFFVNFQGNLENGSGTMWRYFFGFWKTRKTDKKKVQKCKETIHLPNFFRQFSRKPGKR